MHSFLDHRHNKLEEILKREQNQETIVSCKAGRSCAGWLHFFPHGISGCFIFFSATAGHRGCGVGGYQGSLTLLQTAATVSCTGPLTQDEEQAESQAYEERQRAKGAAGIGE